MLTFIESKLNVNKQLVAQNISFSFLKYISYVEYYNCCSQMADECGHIIKIIKIVWLIKDKISNIITAFGGVGKKKTETNE